MEITLSGLLHIGFNILVYPLGFIASLGVTVLLSIVLSKVTHFFGTTLRGPLSEAGTSEAQILTALVASLLNFLIAFSSAVIAIDMHNDVTLWRSIGYGQMAGAGIEALLLVLGLVWHVFAFVTGVDEGEGPKKGAVKVKGEGKKEL